MKNLPRAGIALVIAGMGVWLWLTFFPSPEKVIAARLEKLARAVSARPGEGYIPRMIGAQNAAGYFSTNVELKIDLPNHSQQTILNHDDIVQAIMSGHLAGGFTVKFSDINVMVNVDKETAQAELTLEARVAGQPDLIIQELKVSFRKIDGKWLITRVQTVRTFSELNGNFMRAWPYCNKRRNTLL